MRRSSLLGVLAATLAVGFAMSPTSSAASAPSTLSYLARGYAATSIPLSMPPGVGVGGLAVRSDGFIVIWPITSAGRGWDNYLHLLPPAGGAINAANRFGPDMSSRSGNRYQGLFDLRSLAFAAGELWALGTTTGLVTSTHDYVILWEIDPTRGTLISNNYVAAPQGDQGSVSAQEITPDPTRRALLLTDYAPNSDQGSGSGPPVENVVDMAPDGAEQVVFQYPDDQSMYPRSLLAPPNGAGVLVGEEGEAVNCTPDCGYVYPYDRSGNVQGSIEAPWPGTDPPTDTPVAMAWGGASCPSNTLFLSLDDATSGAGGADLYAIQYTDRLIDSAPTAVATPTPIPGAPANYVTMLSPGSNGTTLFAAWSTLVAVRCLAGVPLPAPPAPAAHAPRGAPAQGVAQYPSSVPASGSSSGVPRVPGAPAGPGQLAQANLQPSAQGAAQGSVAPNLVGVADAESDQPALALPATTLAGRPALEVWWATLALSGMAGVGAALALRTQQHRESLALSKRRS